MKALRSFLMRYRYVIERKPAAFLESPAAELKPSLDLVLAHYLAAHSNGSFVQIGAFDGMMQDPIVHFVRQHHWKGILVEPQPDVFRRLQSHYEHEKQLVLVQAAIAHTDGVKPFYRIRRNVPGLPDWTQMIASFDRSLVLRHKGLIPNVEDLVEEIPVDCLSFSTLLERNGFSTCDLLQIDAEGFDYEIIKMVDFGRIKPAIINYEHVHLTPDDHEESLVFLAGQGYSLAVTDARDTIAYLMNDSRIDR
jgi:FkbM family methyltransferase